ncbi:MAG TPA: riboflavin synthase [Myxococcales bacterium]|nr:riboflavin synthase [Myxococcales bacterium]
MFTGLIRARAKLLRKGTGRRGSLVMVLERPKDWSEVRLGDSIAIHGTCLTVTRLDENAMHFEATEETRKRCRFDTIQTGSLLHVERAMCLGDRIDGHLVTGHVDSLAKVVEISQVQGGQRWRFEPEEVSLLPMLAPRGSVALDGVSLTIVDGGQKSFSVVLVPETLEATELGRLKVNDLVHIEVDLLARYVAHQIGFTGERRDSGGIDLAMLKRQGLV